VRKFSFYTTLTVVALLSLGVGFNVHSAAPGLAKAPEQAQDPLKQLETAWLTALQDKPDLVSLGSPLDLRTQRNELPEILAERLRLLAQKTFSNRQWRMYWAKQSETALKLEQGYVQGIEKEKEQDARREGLRAWAALSQEKVDNQDRYLKAIEAERDGIEERLESLLDSASVHDANETSLTPNFNEATERNPLEKRQFEVQRLAAKIEFQHYKRAESEDELRHLQQQADSLKLLKKALQKDAQLALNEHAIALRQASSGDPEWNVLWQPIAQSSESKAKALRHEVELGDKRQQSFDIEIELAQSQIDYRNERISFFNRAHTELESVKAQAKSFGESIMVFVKNRGWRVLVSLVVIWMLLKLALSIVEWLSSGILRAVKDRDDTTTSPAERRAQTITTVFNPVAKFVAYGIALLVVLEQIGVNTSPVLGSVAILGLAISFGSQNLVRDLVNGFFILLENQFGVGDVVEIGGVTGTVETVNVRSTRLRQLNGTLRIIPNGEITAVANLTRDWSRVLSHIGIAYDSDIALVEKTVNEVGQRMLNSPDWSNRLLEAPNFVGVTALGDSAITVRTMCKVPPGEQWAVERELNRRLWSAFDGVGIDIPFPQQVVWHKNESPQPRES
jgi:moderate conductance mechanosensitive channel